jgi:hypothetical protein
LNGVTDLRQMQNDRLFYKRNDMAELKQQIKEIVEIVALVPEEFKTTCFEMLLKDAIATNKSVTPHLATASTALPAKSQANEKADKADHEFTPPLAPSQPQVGDGADISLSDIHMKVRKFLERSDLTVSNLNELFYKENGGFESLITDLGVTQMKEAQIRITLLQSLHNALVSGDFCTTVELVREECKMRKSYDSANFSAHFKNSSALFDFGTWTKDVTELKLSEEGKKNLAGVIKTLS